MRHQLACLVSGAARTALKPLYHAYYRFLFGRGTALEARIAPLVRRWEESTRMGDVPLPRRQWEEQYAGMRWDLLGDADELARYGVLCSYLHHVADGGSVLDVGCGTGLLFEFLVRGAPERWTRFIGVDISQVAIERARARAAHHGATTAEVEFSVADAENYRFDRRFDAVVLNECLYYFHHPLEQARRYHGALTPHGALLISMFETPRTRAIARQLRRRWSPTTETRVTNRRGTWIVSLYPESRSRS